MKTGWVAREAGVSVHAVRFYEGEGLLGPSRRTEAGYREFSQEDLERVQFIKRARSLGFSLTDVKDILSIRARDQATCGHVRWLLENKVAEIDGTLAELHEFRGFLARLLEDARDLVDCRPEGGRICGIIEGAPEGLLWPDLISSSSAAARRPSRRQRKPQT